MPTTEPTLIAVLEDEADMLEAESDCTCKTCRALKRRAARMRFFAKRIKEAMEHHATAKNDRDPHNASLSALIWVNGGTLDGSVVLLDAGPLHQDTGGEGK